MQTATNTPYVKVYEKNEEGIVSLSNPIDRVYRNDGSNRINRKSKLPRFRTNKRGVSLVIHTEPVLDIETGIKKIMATKYRKVLQFIKLITIKESRNGTEYVHTTSKSIEHLVLCD